MTLGQPKRLPLHDLLVQLQRWQAEPTGEQRDIVARAFQRVIAAHDAQGAYLQAELPPLAPMSLGAGSLAGRHSPPRQAGIVERKLQIPRDNRIQFGNDLGHGRGSGHRPTVRGGRAVPGRSLGEQETIAQRRQLEALDLAVRGIAGVLSVERVLQLIVDRVRELVDAQYAALGIVGPFSRIEQFVTSGISTEQRAHIGALPRGLGMLGLIIREDRSFLVDDISADPRRYGFPENHPR